jgi:lipoic acid synthetase
MSQEVEIKALKGESKVSRLKIRPDSERKPIKKPNWIRIRHANSSKVNELKKTLRSQDLLQSVKRRSVPT